jgi:hypothetical protein
MSVDQTDLVLVQAFAYHNQVWLNVNHAKNCVASTLVLLVHEYY